MKVNEIDMLSRRDLESFVVRTCSLPTYIPRFCESTWNAACLRKSLPDIPSRPHQPTSFSIPKRSFGKVKVTLSSFLASWFHQWPFLHYDEARDLAFRHNCVMGFKEKRMKTQCRSSVGNLRDNQFHIFIYHIYQCLHTKYTPACAQIYFACKKYLCNPRSLMYM